MELLLLPTLQQSLFNTEERPKCTHIVYCLQSNLQSRAFSLVIKVVHFPQVKPVHVGFMLFCCICPCTNTFGSFVISSHQLRLKTFMTYEYPAFISSKRLETMRHRNLQLFHLALWTPEKQSVFTVSGRNVC